MFARQSQCFQLFLHPNFRNNSPFLFPYLPLIPLFSSLSSSDYNGSLSFYFKPIIKSCDFILRNISSIVYLYLPCQYFRAELFQQSWIDPSPTPCTTRPHPHTHMLQKNVLLVQNDDRGKVLCWSLVIISTLGIINKLEGYYLLVLVNSEITKGIITEREYNSYCFLYSIFSRISFPKSKPTSRCVELLCQKSCLCTTKMPFKVFRLLSPSVWTIYAFVHLLIDCFFPLFVHSFIHSFSKHLLSQLLT